MNILEAIVNVGNRYVWGWPEKFPILVALLLSAGLFVTLRLLFIQVRAFSHGWRVVAGKYDDPTQKGDISHFQALTTALSATVGIGNIAGVATAIHYGGPGALFWMWLTAFFGMALKYVECTLSMQHRVFDEKGESAGGPMYYIERGLGASWKPLALFFAFCAVICSFGSGNMNQANTVSLSASHALGVPSWLSGGIMAAVVALVIIGGIKRIGAVTSRLAPAMFVLYSVGAVIIIAKNLGGVPAAFQTIVSQAFNPTAGFGGTAAGVFATTLIWGVKRGLFSNEAGQGSAPIAHAAAKTDEPVREGIVAGLGPFIDTLCVCTITALVILLSGAWDRGPALAFADGTPSLREVVLEDGSSAWQIEPCALTVSDVAESKNQTFDGAALFVVLDGGTNETTGGERHRVFGTLQVDASGQLRAEFEPFVAPSRPNIAIDGAYLDYNGATLTAKAFDRTLPGLGFWMIPAVAWLFAFSTIISWSYYGEQGVVFLLGARSVLPYRIIYCLLILVTAQLVRTQDELDVLSALGTGVMLWANIPIMLIFGPIAMKAYREYFRRLDSGEMDPPHRAPRITDVVEGHDIE